MKRRRFITLLGCGVAWTFRAHAQQSPPTPVIGFLNSATPELYQFNVAAFKAGLLELGYIDGKNVAIEYRWGRSNYDRMPALAAELVDSRVAVIAATGDVSSARAAQAATSTIPVVFTIGGDPVKFGLVETYSRPGKNITGISLISSAIGAKRLELLHEVAPKAKIALLMNPDNPNAAAEQKDAQEAARALGHRIVVLNVRNKPDFEPAFDAFVRERAGALFVATDPMLLSQREPLVEFAARQRVPAIYFVREFATAGGLLSYGASIREMYRQAGIYTGRILKGAKPADLPVLQPTIVELVVNLKTAHALNISLPKSLILRANEVIE
jgi:putative tryptophan/tyrosine transport system substrate-binding protein